MMIIYAWICCLENGWDRNGCIRLGIAIGLCFVSYQFAYSFILGSFLLYCAWYIIHHKQADWKKFFRYGFMIVGIAFLICGWVFIRNAIIYDGDFLALHASTPYAELYAAPEIRPSLRNTFAKQGLSVFDMLRTTGWLKSTAMSTVSALGYMAIWAAKWVYVGYQCLVVLGGIGMILRIVQKRVPQNESYIVVCLLFCAIVTLLISVYYSWSSDYQPQGRYIIVALPFVWWNVARGLEHTSEIISKRIGSFQLSLHSCFVCLICSFVILTALEAFIHCLQIYIYCYF